MALNFLKTIEIDNFNLILKIIPKNHFPGKKKPLNNYQNPVDNQSMPMVFKLKKITN